MNPDKRPSFKALQEWFDRICIHCTILGSFHSQLPSDLVTEINNFIDEYCAFKVQSTTTKSVDNIDVMDEKLCVKLDSEPSNSNSKVLSNALPQPVTILPHLGAKDFNANGERIRDSWRARRKQKIRENRQRPQMDGDKNSVVHEPIHLKKVSSKGST